MSVLANVLTNLVQSALRSPPEKKHRERYSEEEGAESVWGDPNIVAAAVLFAAWLLLVAIAAAVAVSCGAGFRDYVVVVVDPWTYLMIRLAVPCGPRT